MFNLEGRSNPEFIQENNRDEALNERQQGIVYQPLVLRMKMGDRPSKEKQNRGPEQNKKTIRGLDEIEALMPILPENEFQDSLLKELIQNHNCEFLIAVSMYNEDFTHFTNTINGITDNLTAFRDAGVDPSKVACIVIVDGMEPFLKTFNKEKVEFSRFFDEGKVKERFGVEDLMECKFAGDQESNELAHCFIQELVFGKSKIPLKFIFCVKQKNKRKLNTHLWFFGGFCKEIEPKFVMLLDVGTKPLPKSLFYLYEAMVCNDQLAGCCGEIKPMNYEFWKIVVPAQYVEYKFAHMLDKALESVIGYITVLPGAFSAYRWEALNGSPLWDNYFKSICHPELMNAYQSNIYLAEDRVLCLSLVTKENQKYTLRYVKKSIAETDVPNSIYELMAQRRRWINGSWFGLIDTLKHFSKVFHSNHHPVRKCFFLFQMVYYFLNVVFTWFIVGLFCLAFCITISKFFRGESYESAGTILIIIYNTSLFVTFITSLSVKPIRIQDLYKVISVIFGLYQFLIIYFTIFFMTEMNYTRFSREVLATIGTIAAFFALIVIINCEIITVLKGVLHYLFLIPTYVNIFFIYAICNSHDCTWGNRPDEIKEEEKIRIEEFEEFRAKWAILWALCNSGVAYLIFVIYKKGDGFGFFVISSITFGGIAIIILRGLIGIIYLFVESRQKSFPLVENRAIDSNEDVPNSASRLRPSASESQHIINENYEDN